MEQEISQHLKDKLKIIETETDFFSRKPQRPIYNRFTILLAIVYILATVYFAFSAEDNTIFLFLLAFAGLQFVIFLHQKQLFDMYSSACEIIKFYKESDEKRI
jgi:hypothetical protein